MRVAVTGAGGFLGALLADTLLDSNCTLAVTELVLSDVRAPPPRADPRARSVPLDLCEEGACARLVQGGVDLVFHLAAAVSGHAEADFHGGLAANLDVTRALLEAVRARSPGARFVFASTSGVVGGTEGSSRAPPPDESVAPAPQTSYGCAKAMCELLVSEYSRRGFVDGVSLRLPTVTVRAGAANTAVTSYASGVVREPLAGLECTMPVPPEQELWVASPRIVVRNMLVAGARGGGELGARRVLQLPGLRVSARAMVSALRAEAGAEVASRVRWARDERLARIVSEFAPELDDRRARTLGYAADDSFEQIVRDYIQHDLHGVIAK